MVDHKMIRMMKQKAVPKWYILLAIFLFLIWLVISFGKITILPMVVYFLVGTLFFQVFYIFNTKTPVRMTKLLHGNSPKTVPLFWEFVHKIKETVSDLSKYNHKLEKFFFANNYTNTMIQAYFLQNLLRCGYRDRTIFYDHKERFGIGLSKGPYIVLVCRFSSLATPLVSGSYSLMNTALLQKCISRSTHNEYVISLTSETMAIILRLDSSVEDYRSISRTFIRKVLNELKDSVRENLLFGIGRPVTDSFHIPLSFHEAEAAVLACQSSPRVMACFYQDIQTSDYSYSYPLSTEETICRAVRAADTELLQTTIDVLREENFDNRALNPNEVENLIMALRVTVTRLLDEFPKEFSPLRDVLHNVTDFHNPESAFEKICQMLQLMAEHREKSRKNHTAQQVLEIKGFISGSFRDFNLGLTSIAEEFNLSRNYLSSFFKENEGEGLEGYIQRIRMTEAVLKLSSDPNVTIDEVAYDCGYPHTSTFRRAFKRVHGLTPSEYRNKMQKTKSFL